MKSLSCFLNPLRCVVSPHSRPTYYATQSALPGVLLSSSQFCGVHEGAVSDDVLPTPQLNLFQKYVLLFENVRCTVKSEAMATEERLRRAALSCHSNAEEGEDGEEEEEEEGKEEEIAAKRVPATIRSLLMHAPMTLCLHFPRRHQR